MPVSFFGLYRGDGTATADSLFGRRGNNPYSQYLIAFSSFLNVAPTSAP
jgi:hypothetical protein